MAAGNVLLFFHLVGAFSFFAGAALAGTLQHAAIRRERPSEILVLLRVARVGAGLVGVGLLFTLAFGIALAEHDGYGLSAPWIDAALGLLAAGMALGAYGGRSARHARYLAERLATEDDRPSRELHELIAARGPLLASHAGTLFLVTTVVLMVWKPGS